MDSAQSEQYIRLFISVVWSKCIMLYIFILPAIILLLRRIYTFGGILMKPVRLRRTNFRLKWGYGGGVSLLYPHIKFQEA
jgi:hypothetical protein